jgi:hypothetical protein
VAAQRLASYTQVLAVIGGTAGMLSAFVASAHRGVQLLDAMLRGYAVGAMIGGFAGLMIWIGDVITR